VTELPRLHCKTKGNTEIENVLQNTQLKGGTTLERAAFDRTVLNKAREKGNIINYTR
jgi:hypothetical protein